jgi:predicted DNA-binding protein
MEGQPQPQPLNDNEQQQQPQAEIAVPEQQRFKTLGVRIEESLHARLSFIAQLTGNTLADEIKASIEARVRAAQEDPDLVARAEAVQAELQREAEARRAAIAGFFGRTALSETVEQSAAPRRGNARRRAAGSDAGPEQA